MKKILEKLLKVLEKKLQKLENEKEDIEAKKKKKKLTTTSVIELLCVASVLMLAVFLFNTFEITRLEYHIFRLITAIFVFFFVIKIRLHFLISTDFNEKGIKVYDRLAELTEKGFSMTDANSIVTLEVMQENSKHQKVIIREVAERIAIALIIIGLFALGAI